MQTHKVYLTPISPIHIGCGEDFEPTNYVIDDGVLYHFEPSNLNLDKAKRQELLNKVNTLDLLAIQRFFLSNKTIATAQAHYFADVSKGIEQIYQQRIGKVAQYEKDGNKVVAQLAIERTAYSPYSNQIYIPASGLKGALITAILDQKHRENGNKKVSAKEAKALTQKYVGEFSLSLGRAIRFGDFMPNADVQSKVYFSVNHKKVESKSGKPAQGIPLRREAINCGQYRAFCSELVFGKNTFDQTALTPATFIKTLNQFYLPIFRKELQVLTERRLVELNWANSVLKLVEQNSVALIRLGKNGADSKIYQGDGIAQIKIMKGKGMGADYKDRATTIWLAAENDRSTAGLLPFGWALLEFDPVSENEQLKQWCDKQPKSHFDKQVILQKQAELKVEKERQRLAELEKAKAEEEAIAQEQARLSALSPNQKIVEDFLARNVKAEVKPFTDSPVFKEIQALINQAMSENWDKADRQYLFDISTRTDGILNIKVPNLKGSKKEKEFKKLCNKLVAE